MDVAPEAVREIVPPEVEAEMDRAIQRYPADRKRSASMPLLHLWQEHFGFISDEGVRWIAEKLELQPINILELVTFYPMYRQEPVGRKHIRVCRTLSCAMAGSYRLRDQLAEAGGIDLHKHDTGMHNPIAVSDDGKFSIEFVECLASCGTAPVAMVQDSLLENVRGDWGSSVINAERPSGRFVSPPHPLEHRLIFKNIGRQDY
ncbi:MAG TPA: NAD(P)H-dependent oxidoreductase subunit E, partial [Chthoniobacterales bacterium]